jgi:uncharacterized protein YjbJ (UPF0337 family)
MIADEQVTGNWNQLKGKIQERWGQITDDELQEVEGQVGQLVGLIQQKTGQTRQQIEQTLDKFCEECGWRFSEAADRAGEAVRAAAGRAREGYVEAQRLVRQRPAEAVAVAFGTGLIAGVIVGLMVRSR